MYIWKGTEKKQNSKSEFSASSFLHPGGERERHLLSIRPSSFLSLQHIRLKKTKQLVSPSLSTSKTESKGEREREGGYNDLFRLQPCELPLTHSLHLLRKSFSISFDSSSP